MRKSSTILLNLEHPDGASKAKFFLAVGYSVENWEVLADTLKSAVATAPAAHRVDSSHGSKYIVDGDIAAPNGQVIRLRTVWIVDRDGSNVLRLVTAYPRPQGS